ncbi:tetraacyldisaccharide 4'-kinase [uncultured Croceitalea sp.]|uniref:tetraacyldisaccharide 4'-kinase n=1 Tax=uncultured Croceitalea sp. TaxID=1798908 RepID=UPI0033064C50
MQLLRKLAFPISLLYGLVIHIRNYLYDIGFFTSKSYGTPTICVGNLSVGGTGKTPMIEYLVNELKGNHKIAVLSRGYRRKSRGFELAGPTSTVEDLGDEPYQIYTKFKEVFIAVDADRQNGIQQLENDIAPDVILLDDAFQHRRVKASFNILLTAHYDLYSKDFFLPTGNLRDARNQAKRADVVVVTKCPDQLSVTAQENIRLALGFQKRVLFATLSYDELFRSEKQWIRASELTGKKVAVVTGIANPAPFITHLKSQNLTFKHLKYKDHHFFTTAEINAFKKYDFIITTEKDYMRLKGRLTNCFYLGVKHQFLDGGGEILQDELTKMLKHYR